MEEDTCGKHKYRKNVFHLLTIPPLGIFLGIVNSPFFGFNVQFFFIQIPSKYVVLSIFNMLSG